MKWNILNKILNWNLCVIIYVWKIRLWLVLINCWNLRKKIMVYFIFLEVGLIIGFLDKIVVIILLVIVIVYFGVVIVLVFSVYGMKTVILMIVFILVLLF